MRLLLLLLLSMTEVDPGVHLLRGNFTPGSQPDGNTVVFDAPQGLVVVDTGRHAAHTQAILDFAAARGKKIRAVVNTHWHLDHIGGNAMLRREVPDIRVYATQALDEALKGFLANYANQLRELIARSGEQSHRTELALIESGRQLAPDEVVRTSAKRKIAGRTLMLNVETHAVTAGDIWILDPATKTLVAGDLVTLPFPFLDTACPTRWDEALQRIEAADFKTLIPGHGPPMTREQFTRYRRSYSALLACAASERTNAQCADEWLRGVGDLVPQGEHDFARQGLDYYLTQHLRAKKNTCP
jgi:glyoxylase-like metal-dependent hydrolase (beta-lactamase superfamily II)